MEAEKPSVLPLSLAESFATLPDPRKLLSRIEFRLVDVLVLAVVAVICGADTWDEIALFVEGRERWWVDRLGLTAGRTPSLSTFKSLLPRIKPRAFLACFEAFARDLHGPLTPGTHVALDGKAHRGSWRHGLGPLTTVHAWATERRILLGQRSVEPGTGEKTALKTLLAEMDLEGAVLTIDANGASKPLVALIVGEKKADYAIAIKANQRKLHEGIAVRMLAPSRGVEDPDVIRRETAEEGHGRVEVRTQWVAPASSVPETAGWVGAQSVIVQRRVVTKAEARREEWRYFVSSLACANATALEGVLRGHWGIENELHWHLDVTFVEDDSRLRDRATQEIFSVLRRIALTLATHAPQPRPNRKVSLANKRLYASINDDYLDILLSCKIPGR